MPALRNEMRSHSASSSFGVAKAADRVVSLEQRQRLIDDVALVGLHHLHLAPLDQLDHPARIEIDAKVDAAAMLGEMLDGEAKPTWSARPDLEPVASFRKVLIGQVATEDLVVDAEIVDVDARLRDARAAAGFESADWLVAVRARDPPTDRAPAQPFILERAELVEVLVGVNVAARIPLRLRRPFEPERTAGFGAEVPLYQLAHPDIELGARLGQGGLIGKRRGRHSAILGRVGPAGLVGQVGREVG